MVIETECQDVEPLLFALLEGDVSPSERQQALAHLRQCKPCRDALGEEAWLTRTMSRDYNLLAPSKPARPHVLQRLQLVLLPGVVAAALLLFALFAFNTGDRVRAYGSIQSFTILPTSRVEASERSPLSTSNHMAFPAGASVDIDLGSIGHLRAVGPVAFELDRVEASWKLVMLIGQVTLAIENDCRLDIVTQAGYEHLESGSFVVDSLRGATPLQTDAEDNRTPAQLFDAALVVFFQREDLEMAAKLFDQAARHETADPDLRSKALLYLAASHSQLEQFSAASAAATRWYELNPGKRSDAMAGLLITALWHSGDRQKARQIYNDLLRDQENSDHQAYFERFFQHLDSLNQTKRN